MTKHKEKITSIQQKVHQSKSKIFFMNALITFVTQNVPSLKFWDHILGHFCKSFIYKLE